MRISNILVNNSFNIKNKQKKTNFTGAVHLSCKDIAKSKDFMLACEDIKNWFMQFSDSIVSGKTKDNKFFMKYPPDMDEFVEKLLKTPKYGDIFDTKGMSITFEQSGVHK